MPLCKLSDLPYELRGEPRVFAAVEVKLIDDDGAPVPCATMSLALEALRTGPRFGETLELVAELFPWGEWLDAARAELRATVPPFLEVARAHTALVFHRASLAEAAALEAELDDLCDRAARLVDERNAKFRAANDALRFGAAS